MFYGLSFQIYSIKYVFCNFPVYLLVYQLTPHNPNIARTVVYGICSTLVATQLMHRILLTLYWFRLFPFRSPLLRE